jgi:hypothetical protein
MKKKPKKVSLGMVKLFLFCILFLTLVKLYVSHRLATAGKLVAELENKAQAIAVENERLEELISQQSALLPVYTKAEKLGFRPIEKIFYLASEAPVALGRP